MSKPLMVYGCNVDGRRRVIAGVRSRAEYVRLMQRIIPRTSDHYVRNYGQETGNPEELVVGKTYPGILFISPDQRMGDPFIEYGAKGEPIRVEVRLFAVRTMDQSTAKG